MIVFETRIKELVAQLPQIDGFENHFYWGNSGQELNKYLAVESQPYPLIYLTSGYESSQGDFKEVSRNCTFIIAVREKELDLLNISRLEKSYKTYLNPLADYFIQLLDSSSISRLRNGYKLRRIPNYSEANENSQIDLWDVIELQCEVVLNSNCLKPYTWE
mgnify:CR=1 FL=1